MKMLYKFFGLFILLFVLNCKPTEQQAKMAKEDMVLISEGNLFGSGDEGLERQNMIIVDANQWDNLLNKMNSVNNVSDSFLETKIDFSKYTVIAVFGDVKSTGGHSIELNITPSSKNIDVSINRKGPEGMAASVITQPYCIVKLPKSDLPIVFK